MRNDWKRGFGFGLVVFLALRTLTWANSEIPNLWDDPTFQKQFLGTYGFNAEIEPRVTAVEREQMEKLIKLLGTDLKAAQTQLERLAKPEASAVFDFTLGNVYFQQDMLTNAAAAYRQAISKFPTFQRAHKNLAIISIRLGDFPQAIRSFTRMIELGGGDGLSYGLLGLAYLQTGEFLSAESAYRNAILLQPENLDWRLGLARSLFRQQKFHEAAQLCDELIRRNPQRVDFWLLQANAFVGMREARRAAENFEFVRRLGGATVEMLNTLGDIYVNEGIWDMAANRYREAIRLKPDQPATRPLRNVEVLAVRGATSEARELLSELERTMGDRLDDAEKKRALQLHARIAVAEGRGEDAVRVLQELVTLDPLDGEALLLLGQHHARQGDIERAMFYYERAQNLEKHEAEARLRRAQLLVSQAKYNEAVPLLRRAQELQPRESVARYLDQVERLARVRR